MGDLGKYGNSDLPREQGIVTINVHPDYEGLKTQMRSLTEGGSSSRSNDFGNRMGIKSPFNHMTRNMNMSEVFSIDYHDPLFVFKRDLGPQSSKVHTTHVEKVPLVRSALNGLTMPTEIKSAINNLSENVPEKVLMEWVRSCLEFVGVAKGTYTYKPHDEAMNKISVRPIACIIAGVVSVRATDDPLPVGTLVRFMPPTKEQYKRSNWIDTTDKRNKRGKLILYAQPVNRYTIKSNILRALDSYINSGDEMISALTHMGEYANAVIPHVALPQSMKVFALSSVVAFMGSGPQFKYSYKLAKNVDSFSGVVDYRTSAIENAIDDAASDDEKKGALRVSQNAAILQAVFWGLVPNNGLSGNMDNSSWWYPSDGFLSRHKSGMSDADYKDEYEKMMKNISSHKKRMLKLLFCKSAERRSDESRFGYGNGFANNFPFKLVSDGMMIDRSPAGFVSKLLDTTVSDTVESFLLYHKSAMGQIDAKIIKGADKNGRADAILTPGKQS